MGAQTIRSLRHLRSGKVRDIYAVDDQHLLIVASDRVSTFDAVHPTPIPDKGKVLTAISSFWFDHTADLADNHVVSFTLDGLDLDPDEAERLRGRSMLVRQAEVVPFECVARGYLAGSGWSEYRDTGSVCGITLPEGLVESSELPMTIFTPATKAESGHDENVSFEVMAESVGLELTTQLHDLTLALYERGRTIAGESGLLLVDTKFEFGLIDGRVVLIDEVLTPDSSRYWDRAGYEPGRSQPSYDKQLVRDYAASTGWDKSPPAPPLPQDIVDRTRAQYIALYERLTGRSFDGWLAQI